MTPSTLVAVEEYLRTSYDPDVDFVDGVLEERNLGEFDHSDLQSEITYWIRANCRHLGLNAFTELRTRIRPTRYRVPDGVIIEGKRPKQGILERPPSLPSRSSPPKTARAASSNVSTTTSASEPASSGSSTPPPAAPGSTPPTPSKRPRTASSALTTQPSLSRSTNSSPTSTV